MIFRRGRLAQQRLGVLAWVGVWLMVASFIWWQWTSPRQSAVSILAPGSHEPFSVVVIDPGHGGQDSGAMVDGIVEKDLTLDIAQRVDRLLQGQGMATVMTRVGDSYTSLAERAALTNRVPDCIMVSIHFNEGNKTASSGIETYYADHQVTSGIPLVSWLPFLQRTAVQLPNQESQNLAGCIQEALVAHTQAVNRGTKAQQFFVIANVRRPAVLVEGGFLSNKDETAKLNNPDYREQIAGAISEGIFRYRDLLRQRRSALALGATQGTE
jgi:N-acetylmuramoyl-L-alanine amidase